MSRGNNEPGAEVATSWRKWQRATGIEAIIQGVEGATSQGQKGQRAKGQKRQRAGGRGGDKPGAKGASSLGTEWDNEKTYKCSK